MSGENQVSAAVQAEGAAAAGSACRSGVCRQNLMAQGLARSATRRGWTYRGMAVAGIVSAVLGALCLVADPVGRGALMSVVGLQLHLVCSRAAGLMAAEQGIQGACARLLPQISGHVAETLLLVALGHAVSVPALGWAAALAAVLSDHVRVLGHGAEGSGLMPARHRRIVFAVACLLSPAFGTTGLGHLAGIIIAVGGFLACIGHVRAMGSRIQSQI